MDPSQGRLSESDESSEGKTDVTTEQPIRTLKMAIRSGRLYIQEIHYFLAGMA
jgi:hypothetical protein